MCATLHRFAKTGGGDIKREKDFELRLRVGDWRVRFTPEPDNRLRLPSVRHGREADR
jgi:hypothetical protein